MHSRARRLMLVSTRILEFAHHLRANQLPVDTAALLTAEQIAGMGYLADRKRLRAGLRSCFCKSAEHWRRFDSLFDDFWQVGGEHHDTLPQPDAEVTSGDSGSGVQSLVGFAGTSTQNLSADMTGAGDYKALSLADFRFVFDPQQMCRIQQLVENMAAAARRTWLRREKTASKGHRIDISTSIRHSMRTSGSLLRFVYHQRRRHLPRFVLLLDVSQSMDIYARLFLRFARQLMSVFEQSYAYAFNIELVPLGQGHRDYAEADIEQRLNELGKGWLGGTRIAASLASFNQHYLREVVNSKTTVLIFSDGCDTAPLEQLLPELATIQRCAKRLIWVNPLLGRFSATEKDPNMDPLQVHIDSYLSAHNLQSLQLLEKELLK